MLQPGWGGDGPANLTDISGLAEARGIGFDGRRLRIGALETIERVRTDAEVARHAPLLQQACGVIGALGVRLLGTLGGNVGWRQGDALPALLALGAAVETVDGERPLEEVLGPSVMPLILAVVLPPQPGIAVFEKTGHRAAFSPSVATVAGCVDRGTAAVRLASGAAGRPARRLHRAEQIVSEALQGGRLLEPATLAAAMDGGVAGRVLAGLLLEALAA